MAKVPAQIQKRIHLAAACGPGAGEKFIDHFDRAPEAAGGRHARFARAGGTGTEMVVMLAAQFFKVALSIHMVFSCQVRRSSMRSCVCRSFSSPDRSRRRIASSTTFSWA